MIPPKQFRSATFRLALLYGAVFSVSTIALFAFLYWRMTAYGYEQMLTGIDAELEVMRDESSSGPASRLAEEVERRATSAASRSSYYVLLDAQGNRIAGNTTLLVPQIGTFRATVRATRGRDDDVPQATLFRAIRLPNEGYLAIGRTLSDLADLNALVLRSFLAAMALTGILAMVGGLLLSRSFVRRIEAIARTSMKIMAGNMSERVPVEGGNDEIDQLATSLNHMLDRIQQLMETTRQVSNDIAHDLRTPLGRLRQRLERLTTASPPPPVSRELDTALDEIDGILATFSALLRIAQIESGTRRSEFKPVSLTAICETIGEAYAAVAEDKGQIFESALLPGVSLVGDRELLTQMLANLIENAIRHSPPGAQIRIELDEVGGRPEVVVRDTGPGVPAGEREKVLRRFYRLERNRTTAGNGLGLSLVAAVAELHGARLQLEDAKPGLLVRLSF